MIDDQIAAALRARLPADLSGGAISEIYINFPNKSLSDMRAARLRRAARMSERNDGLYVM